MNFLNRVAGSEKEWFSEPLGCVNDHTVSVRVMNEVQADFHAHPDSDEMFLVLNGEVFIDLENESIALSAGQSITVKRGVLHRARVPVHVQMLTIMKTDD